MSRGRSGGGGGGGEGKWMRKSEEGFLMDNHKCQTTRAGVGAGAGAGAGANKQDEDEEDGKVPVRSLIPLVRPLLNLDLMYQDQKTKRPDGGRLDDSSLCILGS
ncbi:hypothetical protein PG990_010677 [Apiospora arundinis]